MSDSSTPPTSLNLAYELLHDSANDISNLSGEIGHLQGMRMGRNGQIPTQSGADLYVADTGPGAFGIRLGQFYQEWATPLKDCGDDLSKLQGYLSGIAYAFFDADASQAAALNASSMFSSVIAYPQQMDQWDNSLLQWFDPSPGSGRTPMEGLPPIKPAAVPNPYSIPGTTDVVTTYTAGPNDPDIPYQSKEYPNTVPSQETTTVTLDGMTFTETTVYGADKGWGPNGPTRDSSQLITNADGSTDTIVTEENVDGSATQINMDSSGTTISIRGGWNGSFQPILTPAKPDDGSGSDGGDSDGGGPAHHY